MDIYPKDDGVLLTEKNSLRKSIHEFIIESQHKDGILDSEWKTLLNFIKKAMEICPEVLVVNSRCVVSTQDHAFLLWVIQNLLMVLTQATSVHLQTGIGDCIQNIFTLTESRDHPVFCYLLRETVQMVSDLSDLYQISTTPNIVKFPVYLSHYQNSPTKTKELKEQSVDSFPLELLPMLVEINNVTQLGLLLENMLLTMNCFCDEVCMFYPGATNLVYQIVCSTLRFGDLNIKLASLTIIESLIKGGEFASTALMDNVLWSLISTVTFCTRLLLENERVPDEFQHKLCSCLRICFCPSEGEPYAVLRFWDYLLSAVQCVLTHQSYSLCSPDLQVCVGQVLHRCSLMTIFLPSFRAEVIIDSVGKVKNLQPLVPALYQLLRAELSSKNVDGEVGSKEDSEKSEYSLRKSTSLLHHLCQQTVSMAREVVDISKKHLSQLPDVNELLYLLEGIRVILDVYPRLCTIESFNLGVWWNNENLELFCTCWDSSLSLAVVYKDSDCLDENKSENANAFLDKVLSVILDSIGALFASGVIVSSSLIDRCLRIVMLPWPPRAEEGVMLQTEGSVHSLSSDRFRLALSDVHGLGVTAKLSKESSLWAVAALKKNVSDAKKLHCFNCAMDDDSSLVATVIKALPLLLTSLVMDDAVKLLNSICTMNLLDNFPDSCSLYIEQVPAILTALSGRGVKRSSINGGYSLPIHQGYTFELTTCKGYTIEGQLLNSVLQPVLEVSHPNLITELLNCFAKIKSGFDLRDSSRLDQKLLDLFTHNDPSVQTAVSSHIQLLFTDRDGSLTMSEIQKLPVVVRLKETYQLGAMNGDIRLQEFTVLAFGKICRFSEGNLFTDCLIALLKFYLEPSLAIKSVAYVQLQKLAKSLKLSVAKLLSRWKEPICEFVVGLLHEKKLLSCTTSKKENLFHQVAAGFQVDQKKFFEITRDILVPLLICRASSEASSALKLLADILNTSTRSLIMDSFKYVFLHLIQRGGQKDLQVASDFLKSEAEFEMADLLRSDSKNVLNQLLLHLSTSRDRVLSGVKMLAELEPHGKKSSTYIEYLQPHLLGVIAFFNFTLVRIDLFENSSRGLLALESLIKLLELMGPNCITDVKMKVITMLRHCLTFKDDTLIRVTLQAWNCFIHCVQLDSLGPLLGQIVVALSPFVEGHPEAVSDIFNFLIVENRSLLSSYFNEIYLMPETRELAEVNSVLKNHSETPRSLHEQLRHVLKGVAHERSDVTRDALKSLYSLLKNNKVELQKYMVGSDTVDPIITEIVTTLLLSLRGADAERREQYGKCLGELGAIDPGKLDIPIAPTCRVVKFYEINASFVVDLLSELARAYLAASNTRSQDCCAFAIQEILKLFDCKNTDPDSDGAQIWSLLTAECQEVLRPHLYSSYSASVPDPGRFVHPIFKLSKKMNFHQWLQKWCSYLIHKLDDGVPKKLFLPCSLIFQHDKSIAQYLLPYILTCLLSCVTSDVAKQVLGEVMAVLKSCAHNRDTLTDHADFTNMCAQTIFTALDHLSAWTSGKNKATAVRKAKGLPNKGTTEEVQNVTSFLQRIPKEVLAHAAFRCQAYTRSLMYFESHLKADNTCVKDHLDFLQRVYIALGDSDGVTGAAVLRTSDPSLSELTLQYESTGNHRDAGACYERAIQINQDDISNHEGLLRCMIRQGEFTSALMHVDGLQSNKPTWLQRLNTYRVEAAWNLGQWDVLQTHLKTETPGSKNWNVNLGRLLLTAKQKDVKVFLSRLSKVRMEQMGPLCTASLEQGSYQRAYEYIVRLHMLQELEEGITQFVVNKHQSIPTQEMTFLKSWEARFQLVQESFRTQEPILSLRRVILGIESRNDKEVGKSWLRSAKIARRDGHLQTALSFLLNARDYSLPEHCMEWAEYKKTQLSSYEALQSLQKAVNEQWPETNTPTGNHSSSSTQAEALLLIGRWMEDTAHYDTQTVLKQYKNVTSVQPESEDGHFFLGKYYDRLMTILASDRPTKSGEFLQFIVRHYGHALQYGSKYIYQCMPRMMTLWLDFGSNIPDSGKRSQERSALKNTLSQLNELIKTSLEVLPPYQFLIAFSQLISRVCHPNTDVFTHLEEIVLKLLRHYPQQALWMMIAVSKSTHSDRRSRCERILTKAKQEVPDIGKLIDDIVKLSDKLLDVCNKHVDPAKSYSMDRLCRSLPRLLNSSGFSSIMVPLQSSMTVTLPGSYGESYDHNPFPGIQPSIVRFDDKVEVLASLQRPKKITVIGSDGNSYILLCKPKDDLRKDARLMEFNTIVNKCLRKDQNSRQRRLHIRTYAVVPLNEECGLLEWVPNTHGFRNILSKLYQEMGCYMSGRDLKDIHKATGSDVASKRELFLTKLLPRQPAVFGEWFLRTFPDPTAWYSSRQAYGHTAAVMSIVGYILGLGDRHGENILFDSTSGDCVHVDFNCLFNRGETFDVPEVVPFRLTHNMVHGMGVTGYEGMFRKSCEATMKVLRQECDALMCVLKTFIHDPLVEWEKVKGRSSSEAANEKPVKIIHDIEDRLNGKYPKSKGLPLSVEGQVHALIKEATDVNNLCRMYVGWAPFM